MGRPRKPFKIVCMKVPLEFRKHVLAAATKAGVQPSDYLWKKIVVHREHMEDHPEVVL